MTSANRPSNELRLAIEPVPKPLWGVNLRSAEYGMGESKWQSYRKALLAQRGPACVICQDTTKPQGHECWAYSSSRGQAVARLTGINFVCARCHGVKHLLRIMMNCPAEIVIRTIKQFLRINDCDMSVFECHEKQVRREWRRVNKLRWTVDFGQFGDLVPAENLMQVGDGDVVWFEDVENFVGPGGIQNEGEDDGQFYLP